MQNAWTKELNPVLAMPLNQGIMLEDITLQVGANVINHLLGRKMIGWIIIDQDAQASMFRSQPLNNKTLTLTSDAIVTLKLWVF